MIHIADYGCGNLASIASMLRRLHVDCTVSSTAEDLRSASRIILPGVGTFDTGMRGIRDRGLEDILHLKALDDRVPILGVCLGAQLMTAGSDEGSEPGLGWLPARTVTFDFERRGVSMLPLPNIGWREVAEVHPPEAISLSLTETPRYYFVHKYHFEAPDEIVWMRATYGYEFPAALQSGNLWSVQFHPEKSHRYGMRLLEAFAG